MSIQPRYIVLGVICLFQAFVASYADTNNDSPTQKADKFEEAFPLSDSILQTGQAFAQRKEFDSAFHYFHKSLIAYDTAYDALGLGSTYMAMGDLLFTYDDHDHALEYYFKALENIEPGQYTEETIRLYLKIADTFLQLTHVESAEKYVQKALQLLESEQFALGRAKAALMLGKLAMHHNEYQLAMQQFHTAAGIYKTLNQEKALLAVWMQQLKSSLKSKDYSKAQNWVESVEQHSRSVHDTMLQWEINKLLTKYYLETRDFDKAEVAYQRMEAVDHANKDVLKLAKAFADHENKQSISQLKEQQSVLNRVQAEVKAQQWVIFILIITSVIIMVFMIIINRFNKRNKRANQELLQQNEEINNNSQELIMAKEKAEESDRLKSAFLANMSHEVRTPMNSIIGFAKLLCMEDIPPEKKKNYTSFIENNGRNLVRLIDELIDLSKLESNQLVLYPEHCNLHQELQSIAQQFEQEQWIPNNLDISLKLVLPQMQQVNTFLVDRNRFRQVLTHLLLNAVKFTKKGLIKFGYTHTTGKILFFVQDSGIGIDPQAEHVIFNLFRQVDDGENREYGGTGHGLALCKSLVKLMGGDIWYDSELNQGTVFYFTLPAKEWTSYHKDRGTLGDKATEPNYTWPDKTVLIVEDDDKNYLFLQEMLHPTKMVVIRANSGLEAIKAIKKKRVDIVLMNMKMPVMDGYEATRKIKQLNKNIPVIAQAAFEWFDEKQKCLQAGCDAYISKPVRWDELLNIMDQFLMLSDQ